MTLVETPATHTAEPVAEPASPEPTRAVEWLTMEVSMRRETHEQLERARELLSHVFPDGELADVLQRILAIAIPELVKQKLENSGLPIGVARRAWERSNGHCEQCGSRWQTEFDHRLPKGRGGEDTLANIQLLCRECNQHKADVDYGGPFMQGKRERRAQQRESGAAAR